MENKKLTKDQLSVILKNAPKSLSKTAILDQYVLDGYELEGVDTNLARQNAEKRKANVAIPSTKTDLTFGDKLKEAGQDFLGIGEDILSSSAKRVENIQKTQQSADQQSALSSRLQGVGQLAGAGADAITAVGKGTVNLALSDKSEKAITDVIGKFGAKVMANPQVQNIINKYNELPEEQQRNIDAVGGVVDLVSNFIGGSAVSKGTDIATTGFKKVGQGITETGTGIINAIPDVPTGGIIPDSASIMNRVARLNPSDATKFEKLAGKTHGEYLKETGNFGTPDKIISTEATKFTNSINSVDNELAKLPGTYNPGVVQDVLNGLIEKAKATSSDSVKSPFFSKVTELNNKFKKEGLSMSEINDLKRLYEREVKLGYNKLTNGDKVAQATNVDNALREWQVKQAEDLGFSNISDLNKQTQLSKFIINKLGDKVVGQTGLNGVSLTDWIMLSGGNPTAVAGFLTKKFFSSKNVQSKIAKLLNEGEVKGQITPKTKITPSNIERRVSPQGFKQLPEGKSKTSQNLVPIIKGGKFEMEKGVPKTSKK